eukprot:gene3166-3374_t
MTSNQNDEVKMKPMSLFRHTIAYVTLGLLCGWYYFIFLLYPTLIILALRGSYVAGSIFAFFLFLTYVPLSYEPWEDFMYCWIWGVWKEYFDFTYDDSSIKGKLKDGERYIFFEFPHGIFPMAEIVEVKKIDNPTEEQLREVMDRVMKSVNDMHEKKRPAWETRKLVFL